MGFVVVVNGWYRTGSTLCFYAVQRILAARGLPFRVEGQDFKLADRMIAEHLARNSNEWLVLKSHHWLPGPGTDRRLVAIYTKRHPADVMRSSLDYLRRKAADEGVPFDVNAFLGQHLAGLQWLLLFYRYVLPKYRMHVVDYESYYGQPDALIEHLARLLGLALTPEQIVAVRDEIDVRRVKAWTDTLDAPADPQSHFRKLAVSESLGRPNGSTDDLPEPMRILIDRGYP